MKKSVLFIFVFVALAVHVSALSSTMDETYRPRETIIAQLSQDILSTISPDQMNLLRNGYIDVGFQYGIEKIQGGHSFWLITPSTAGNYTLKIEDVVVSVNGAPEVIDFYENFVVNGSPIDYSISPGVISTNGDFQITVYLYEDFSKTIQTDFPEQHDITLWPGSNTIKYNVSGIFGNQLIDIAVGDYVFPAYLSRPENICGDGIVSGEEICDGTTLLGVTCESLNSNYTGGALRCAPNCFAYNKTACTTEDGSAIVIECGKNHLDYCETEDDCDDFEGYWYDDSCHAGEVGTVCDQNHKELCENPIECVDAEGYWYDDVCNYQPETTRSEPTFTFIPEEMNLTILITGQLPSYTFKIKNTGSVPIENLELDYSKTKFVIVPENNISIGVNESVDFNLGIARAVQGEVQGAVVAIVGDVSEYLVVTLRGTDDANEVRADYGGRNDGEGYKCVALGGLVCDDESTCSTAVVSAIDTDSCCTGICQTSGGSSEKSYAWLGYLIGGIIIVGGLIVFLKYRKTKSPNPVKQRFALAEKKLP